MKQLLTLLPLLIATACGRDGAALFARSPDRPDPNVTANAEVVVRRIAVEADTGKEQFYHIAPSADGKFFVGLLNTDGNTNLAVRDLLTGVIRRLTTDADGKIGNYADYSRLSPDGKLIAYTWFSNVGSDSARSELRLMAVDGSQRRTLLGLDAGRTVYASSWTADFKRLLAQIYAKDGSTQATLIELKAGSSRVIRSFDWRGPRDLVAISPDGAWLAYDFEERNSTARDIIVISTEGGREAKVTTDGGVKYVVGWSPDGAGLFYRTVKDNASTIWYVPLRDGKAAADPRIVRSDLWDVTSTLDITEKGLYYFVSDYKATLNAVTMDREAGRALAAPVQIVAGADVKSMLIWSPDSRQVAYVRRTFLTPTARMTLVMRQLATGEERTMPLQFVDADVERWSADGRSIQLLGRIGGRYGHYRLDLASGETHFVTPFGTYPEPVPSADGRSEYIIRNDKAQANAGQVVARDVGSGSEREIYRGAGIRGIRLAPDGKFLALRVGNPNGPAQLVVVSTAGGEVRQLFSTAGVIGPNSMDWSPDNRQLIFKVRAAEGAAEELMLSTLATGKVDKLLSSRNGIFASRFSPDGRQVSYSSASGGATREVWIMENLPGTTRRASR